MTNRKRTSNSITNCLMLLVEMLKKTVLTKQIKYSQDICNRLLNQNIYSDKHFFFYKSITRELVASFYTVVEKLVSEA